MILFKYSVKITSTVFLCILFFCLNSSSVAQNYIARVEGKGNKWFLINEKGEQIGNNTFSHLNAFSDGLAGARKGGLWGYIDANANWIINPDFFIINPYSCGIAAVAKDPEKFKYIDQNGMTVAQGPFEKAFPCTDNLFFAKRVQEYEFRLFNKEGKELDPNKRYKEVYPFKNGFAVVRTKEGWQIINTKGEWVFKDSECSFIKSYQDGMFAYRSKGKWGFIDSTFVTAIDPIYDAYTGFENGYSRVQTSRGEIFLIGKNGKPASWSQGYTAIGKYSEGLLAVKKGEQWGFVNTNGEMVIPCNYSSVKPFSCGIALAKNEKGHWGYIDTKGEWKINPDLLGGKNCKHGFVLVKVNPVQWGFISSEGVKLPNTYDNAYNFEKISSNNQLEENTEIGEE